MKNEALTPLEALKQLKKVLPWVNWIATDQWGRWYIFDNKPVLGDFVFYTDGYRLLISSQTNIAFDGNWKDSLTSLEQEGE